MNGADSWLNRKPAGLPKVVFPDAADRCVFEAALELRERNLAEPVLIGNPAYLHELSRQYKIDLRSVRILKPRHHPQFESLVSRYLKNQKVTVSNRVLAAEAVQQPLIFAALLLKSGLADMVISGNHSAMSTVLKTGLQLIGLNEAGAVMSSFAVLHSPAGEWLAAADPSVVVRPTAVQLSDIARRTARNFSRLTGETPRVALLSFSTKGSARHEMVDIVQEALSLVQKAAPYLTIDGELQFDAALIEKVAKSKAPNSPVAGKANVLIFPSLNAANIGLKIMQRMGGYRLFGPIIQGLAKCWQYVPAGCNKDDIVELAQIGALLQTGEKQDGLLHG